MDRKLTEQQLQELISMGQASRRQLGADYRELKRKLDFPLRLKESLRSQPATWLAGSVVAGLATSMVFRGKRKHTAQPKNWSSRLLGLTLTATRPLLKVWLANKLKQWTAASVSRSFTAESPDKLNPLPSRSHVRPPGS